MKYEQPRARTKTELDADLNSDDRDVIVTALISAALHESDRRFVESKIVTFLQHQDPWVRGAAAIAAGHVVRIHRMLAPDQIIPLLHALLEDPLTSGKAQDALGDIKMFLGR
jgi:hypothetical protein